VELPIDADKYYEMLQEKIETSTVEKKDEDVTLDVAGSH
jgi:hypothetical protein